VGVQFQAHKIKLVSVPYILNNSKSKIGKLKTTSMHVMETNKIAMVKKRKEERN
jgi:hypothetical protein